MKGTLILTVGLVAMTTLVGCGANSPIGPGAQAAGLPATKGTAERNDLIGTWQMPGGVGPPAVIIFKVGGQVEVNEEMDYKATVTVLGTYQVDGNRLILTVENADAAPQILERFTKYTYVIDGDTLTLSNADGTTKWAKL